MEKMSTQKQHMALAELIRFAPELAADQLALAEFEESYNSFLDALNAQENTNFISPVQITVEH